MYGRLSVLPDQAQPLQRSALMAAVSVGTADHPASPYLSPVRSEPRP